MLGFRPTLRSVDVKVQCGVIEASSDRLWSVVEEHSDLLIKGEFWFYF